MGKKVLGRLGANRGHWVGDGFPVRSLFSYHAHGQQVSPFLLLDYAGPYNFEPAQRPRGVGQHPHRGFETLTIVYDGPDTHKDSAGNGGTIGAGDVQWMTAGGGIIHEEFHSHAFTRTGGPFRMVQLWVNLPAKDKMSPGAYQGITSDQIPVVEFDGGRARIIAGRFGAANGPARTFTPVNVWDLRLNADAEVELGLPEGHTAMIVVLPGHVTVNVTEQAGEAEVVLFDRAGAGASVRADGESMLLVLTGEPIDEPIAGYGPFVMNTEAEIRQAIDDFNAGRFGTIAA